VAAVTTSLPEAFGGSRNWDYRYVWLRDASLTLSVLVSHGYLAASVHWRNWLLRAVAGDPADVQIMYGIAGERDLDERELTSLPGYQGAAPVRIGNGASTQFQGDVIGEVMMALYAAREAGSHATADSWSLQRALIGHLEQRWDQPDNGIWEIRGQLRHFTHSRVMVWAALDPRSRASRSRDSTGRSTAGGGFATASAPRSKNAASTRCATPTSSTTAAARSTRRCFSSRRWATAPTTIRACSARWPRSSRT
jgi:GH15 family glucan-1,4-alpha-glucosidase